MLEHFALAFAAHAAYDFSKNTFAQLFLDVAKTRPDLEAAAQRAAASGNALEAESVFQQAVGVIIAEADAGSIQVQKAILTALKGIKFDHQHGRIDIGDSTIAADVLITRGSAGATGETIIGGNTELKSKGTAIKIGDGASIKITGGARIKQT
jgi:hypothetical protein